MCQNNQWFNYLTVFFLIRCRYVGMTEMHFDCCGGAFEAVFAQANYTKVLAKSYTTLVSVQVSQAPAAGPGFMWTLWEMLNRNECIPVRYEFIPERNEFIPNRNEIIPDRYWNLGSWIVSKNKTFYVGKGSGSIIFNFQAAAAVERKKGELCLLKVLCGMNSFQSGMNSF